MLVVDLPPEEAGELKRPARANGLDLIYLLAPTTPIERSRAIARSASGFLYYVSLTGVTGARTHLDTDIAEHMRELRGVTDLPIGVGFGISTPAQAAEVATMADAVVVGSAISLLIEAHAKSGDCARSRRRTGWRDERRDEGGAPHRARARRGEFKWLSTNRPQS